jgi:hypothetical protein
MILVYSGQVVTTALGLLDEEDDIRRDTSQLENDLKAISQLFGKVSWNPRAADLCLQLER